MKEMIKKMREERGGFTLAELLVVVAIVAVLVAIAVPLFSSSLTSAEDAVKKANERSVKAEVTTGYLADGLDKTKYDQKFYSANDKGDLTGPLHRLLPMPSMCTRWRSTMPPIRPSRRLRLRMRPVKETKRIPLANA